MRFRSMLIAVAVLLCHARGLTAQETSPSRADTTRVVTEWLRANTVPITSIEPGSDYADLRPLRDALRGVQVIGLGEATHGSREIFQMKHRLVEFLVKELGFTALAMEASFSGCEAINDYVLTGKGDPYAVLSAQGYTAWDNEEFLALVEWLRAHNRTMPAARKVHFYGTDVLLAKGTSRDRVLAYLRRYAPGKVASTDTLFRLLTAEEYNAPDRGNQTALASTLVPLRELRSYLADNKQRLTRVSSARELEQIAKYVEVMEQGVFTLTKDVPARFAAEHLKRDDYQWQNLQYLMRKERPNTKFMIWQHNSHVSYEPDMIGFHLRRAIGDKYYSLALQTHRGTFQSRVKTPEGNWAALTADTMLAAPRTLGSYFVGAGKGNAFLNMRRAPTNPIVERWLHTALPVATGHWVYRGATANFHSVKVGEVYDGMLFIEQSTPTRPTKNALERSARWLGF